MLLKSRHRSYKAAEESQVHVESRARELLEAGLKAAGLTATDLQELPGSDPRKVAIARKIWENTIMKMPQIVTHLAMRGPANASQQIHRFHQHPPPLPRNSKHDLPKNAHKISQEMSPDPFLPFLLVVDLWGRSEAEVADMLATIRATPNAFNKRIRIHK